MDEILIKNPTDSQDIQEIMGVAQCEAERIGREGALMMEFDMERELRIRDVFLLLNQHIGERGDFSEQPIQVLRRIIAERDEMAKVLI